MRKSSMLAIALMLTGASSVVKAADQAALDNDHGKETDYFCSFNQGSCTARIEFCEDDHGISTEDGSNCRNRLVLSCSGAIYYGDGAFGTRRGDDVFIQGITTAQWPTPPAIWIDDDDHHNASVDNALDDGHGHHDHDRMRARLFAYWGVWDGSCRKFDDHHGHDTLQ